MSQTLSSPTDSQLSRGLSVLNKLSHNLTKIENPRKILHQIATDAREVLGADIVDLYEYHQARQEFVLPPLLIGERIHDFVPDQIYEDDVVFKVVQQGRSEYYKDSQHAASLTEELSMPRPPSGLENRFVIREKVVSSVSLPLKAGNEIVGVMFVNYRTAQDFEEEQRNLIESFANLAAIQIQNSRQWAQQNKQLTALQEIINFIGADNPLEIILQQAATLFSANYGSISRLTEDGQHLEYKAQWADGQLKERVQEEAQRRSIHDGITGRVVRTGIPFRTGDVREVEYYSPWIPSTRSEMAIPLRNAFGGVIGVLNLESNYLHFFSEEHEKLGVSFANAASAAIQQSDLLENVEALHVLTEWHNINELLDLILKKLLAILGANTATSVNLYDRDSDSFYAFYGLGLEPQRVEKYLLIPPREHGTGRYVLKTHEPLYYEDVANIPEGLPQVRQEAWDQEIKSFAVLPLLFQEEVVGALFIHKIGEQLRFTEDAKRILETYAAQTALAIHNARQRIEIGPLRDILNATISENQETILELIVQNAVHLMSSDYASIWLGDKTTGDLRRAAVYIKPEEEKFLNPVRDLIRAGQPSINMSVYKSGKSIVLHNVEQEEKAGRYIRNYQKAKSEMTVALVYQNEVIGTLNAESQNLGAFSVLDMDTFRVFADVASSAIKMAQSRLELQHANATLQRRSDELSRKNDEIYHMNYHLDRKNKSFEALTLIGQELTASVQRGEQEILSIIHKQASRVMDTDNMYIALYDPKFDRVTFQLAYVDGRQVDIQKEPGWEPRSGGKGRTEWIIHRNSPILNYTKDDADNWYNQPDAKEYIGQTFASWLGVPITFGDEVLGVMATYHKTKEYAYDPDDLRVLTLMGRQAAIALQNARLIRQLDRRIVELDKIRELGEELGQGD